MAYLFFDKNGYNLNLALKSADTFYSGNLFFERISVGLISVEHIYVLTENFEPVEVAIEFEDGSIFKGFSNDNGLIKENVSSFNTQINIYAEAAEEGIYSDTIKIYKKENGKLLAKINLEAEFIGEDERFKILLNNLYSPDILPNADDYFAFKEANIKNSSIDFKILNAKRKELIMLGPEIFSYIGADKALVNMIYYFGYVDVDVKEVYKNINEKSKNFNKLKYIQNKYQAFKRNEKVSHEDVNPNEWKKLNRFSLAWKLNKTTGDIDEFGLPVVENTYDYTVEEALIKFKKLTEYLNKKFLPLNVKLHSITGEGIYFEKIGVNTFNENTTVNNISLDLEPEIEIVNKQPIYYIEDLRVYDNKYQKLYTIDATKPFNEYLNSIIALSDPMLAKYALLDKPDIPIAARVELRISSLFEKVKDLNFSFSAVASSLPFATWKNIKFGTFYECEWLLTNKDTGYTYRHRDFIQNAYKHIALLKEEGTYDLQLTVWNLENAKTIKKIPNAITVKAKTVLINGLYVVPQEVKKISDFSLNKLKDLSGKLKNLYIKSLKIKDLPVKIKALDMSSYLHDENFAHYEADIIGINRAEQMLELSNTNGIGKLKFKKAIIKNTYSIEHYEVKSHIDDGKIVLVGDANTLAAIVDDMKAAKGLLIPFYTLELVTYTLESLDGKYYFIVDSLSYLDRFKDENGNYFYATNAFKDGSSYKVEIPFEIYDGLNANSLAVYKVTNSYYDEIVNADFDSNLNAYTLEVSNMAMVEQLFSSGYFYFDVIAKPNTFSIEVYSASGNKAYIKNFEYLNAISCLSKIAWTDFDVSLPDVEAAAEFNIDDYLCRNNYKRTFLLKAASGSFSNTFFTISSSSKFWEIAFDARQWNASMVAEYLNSLGLPFYFIPYSDAEVEGIFKVFTLDDSYTVECFNGLKVDDSLQLTIKPTSISKINFNSLIAFNSTEKLKAGQQVLFTFDETRIAGLKSLKVKIAKDDKFLFETSRKYFSYKFLEPGSYTFEIEGIDSNGNVKSEVLNNFVYVE